MNKLKLLVTASLLVGGGVFALSAADGVTSAKAAESNREYIYDFTSFDDFSTWNSSYKERVVNSENFGVADLPSAEITFDSANKQSQTIDNMPVTKGSPITFALKEEGFIVKSFTLTCKQWNTKKQTITAKYSTDGLSFSNIENLSSDSFLLNSGDISSYSCKWIKFLFSSQSNQIGIESLKITLQEENQLTDEKYFETLETKTSLKASGTIKQQDVTAIDFNTYDVASGLTYGPEDIENKLKTTDDSWSVTGNGVEIEEYNGIKFAMQSQGYITFSNNNKKFSSVSVTLKYIDNLEVTTEENKTPIKPINLKGDSYIFNFNEPTSSFTIKNIYKGYANLTDSIIINESPLAEMDNLSIRFGTNIPMDKFVKEASYGIILADGTKIAEGSDLNKLYNGSTTAADYVTHLKQQNISAYQTAFTSDEIAYVATPNSTVDLDETDPTAKYAQFALVIDDLLEHMDQTFAAVCYMEYEGQLYLMKEARHSINSVVDAYLADEETMSKLTDNSIAILNALNAM